MIDKQSRQAILKQPRPEPPFRGEPLLGSWYTDAEMEALNRVVRESNDWRGDGFSFASPEVAGFEGDFARYIGVDHVICTTSAGAGLDMAAMCLDLKPGDEVIIPAINFRAAAHSVIGQGGKVVWCDVDQRTFCADPADVERRITPRTRAILATHMNGLSADMDALAEVAARHGDIKVIGDAARSCGGGYKGVKIGKRGWMNIFSFQTQKVMTTLGEGGAVVTDDPDLAERLRQVRHWGHGGHSWGTNLKMTRVQAAVGVVQLRRLPEMLAARQALAMERNRLLAGVPELALPYTPEGYEHIYYLYTMLVSRSWAGAKRDRLIQVLEQDYGVGCTVGNRPCYLVDSFLSSLTPPEERLPLSDELGERLISPSIHPLMTPAQNEYVCAAIIEAAERVKAE